MRSLARDAGLTDRYVGKVFRCAFLAAPDVVEAILGGRQLHADLRAKSYRFQPVP